MSKPIPVPRKQRYIKNEKKVKDKYKTDLIRPKKKEILQPIYNTTPSDRYSSKYNCCYKEKYSLNDSKLIYDNGKCISAKGTCVSNKHHNSGETSKGTSEKNKAFEKNYWSCYSQCDYLRNNLCIKSCIGKHPEELKFQMRNANFRNYTPKILNQEINLGMWI